VIPKEDWDEQLKQGKEIVEQVFHQSPKGFGHPKWLSLWR